MPWNQNTPQAAGIGGVRAWGYQAPQAPTAESLMAPPPAQTSQPSASMPSMEPPPPLTAMVPPEPTAPDAAPTPALEALQSMKSGPQTDSVANFLSAPGSIRQGIGERTRPSLAALQGLRY